MEIVAKGNSEKATFVRKQAPWPAPIGSPGHCFPSCSVLDVVCLLRPPIYSRLRSGPWRLPLDKIRGEGKMRDGAGHTSGPLGSRGGELNV